MARAETVTVELTDDLDGSRADETISFAFEGKAYEIDLSKRNASAFRKLLTPYVDSARRQARRRTSRARSASIGDSKAIRTWAIEQGIEVPSRGRIPMSVIERYEAAR